MKARAIERVIRAGALFAVLALPALAGGCGGLTPGGVAARSAENRGVYAPSAVPYGKTYGEWTVAWWQWIFGLPAADNPGMDETGGKAAIGQSGPVWFLVGTFGSPTVERRCTIPAGKAILFPIINNNYVFNLPSDTEEIARTGIRQYIDLTSVVEASVDGVPLQGLNNYRFESPSTFLTTFDSEDPFYQLDPLPPYPAGTFRGFSDGYWVMLEPLSPGEHTITWYGKLVVPSTFPNVDVFEQRVTYHVTVE